MTKETSDPLFEFDNGCSCVFFGIVGVLLLASIVPIYSNTPENIGFIIFLVVMAIPFLFYALSWNHWLFYEDHLHTRSLVSRHRIDYQELRSVDYKLRTRRYKLRSGTFHVKGKLIKANGKKHRFSFMFGTREETADLLKVLKTISELPHLSLEKRTKR